MPEWLMKVAPTVASALFGPLGAVAAPIIADLLGMDDKSVDSVKDAITKNQLSGEQIAALKKSEIELQVKEKELGIRFVEIEAADRASARDMQVAVKSKIPGGLAILVTVGFFGILSYMLTGDYKPSDALLVMLGSLGTAWTSIVSFYFGSSHGSSQKNDLIGRLSK